MAEHFLQVQQHFTGWLRHPEATAAPAGIEPRRLAIYRELLFNNVMTFVEGTFPIALALLPESLAQRLKSGFFADFECHSPFFYDISLQFREYVDSLDWPELTQYPWLPELLHFEWMELAADIAEDPNPSADAGTSLAADGFPGGPDQILRLAAPVWPLAYQWRVHAWHRGTDAAGLQPAPVCLLVCRDREEQVQTVEVEPLAAWLVEIIQGEPGGISLQALADRLSAATPGLDNDLAISACTRILATLNASGIAFHA